AALAAAAGADRLEPVAPLVSLLDDDDGETRARAADALARITNRRFGDAWGDGGLAPWERARDASAWRSWIDKLKKTPRDAWVASGFVAAGFKAPRLDAQHAWELVRALGRRDHLAYNAHRALERIVGHRVGFIHWDDAGACGDWLHYLNVHRATWHLEKAPKATVDACRAALD
ncbi:MAG TPA: hypothetical protein VHB21_10535, partial [Minicystis sp.]|nr:hypothetical protein [Minicystis sp.]